MPKLLEIIKTFEKTIENISKSFDGQVQEAKK